MNPDLVRRRDEILEQVLDLPAPERTAFVALVCGSDMELRSELERLLAVNERMDAKFLADPADSWITPQLAPGQRIGRYYIERLIGIGGMSRVYEARDPDIGRVVALKVFLVTQTAGNERFFRELRSLGRIRNDNVVQVYDYGESAGIWYIVMELLEGEDLGKAIAGKRCGSFPAKLDIARQLANALARVHATGIVHRDIKPANVFLEPSGRVKIMDFGIALAEDNAALTQTNALIGTPQYLAPERVKGQPATTASDIYAFGVLLFELFTGTKAFVGNTAEVLYKVIHQPIPLEPLRTAGLPQRLTNLIRNATAKASEDRPPSFDAIIAELSLPHRESQVEPLRVAARRRMLQLAAVAAAAAIVIVVVNASWPKPPTASVADAPRETVRAADREQSQAPVARSVPEQTTRSRDIIEPPDPGTVKPSQTDGAAVTVKRFNPPQSRRPVVNVGTEQALPMPPRAAELGHTAPAIIGFDNPVVSMPNVPAPEPRVDRHLQTTHVQSTQEVLAVIRAYVAAYRAKNIAALATLQTGMSEAQRRRLEGTFASAKAINFELTPESAPEFSGPGEISRAVVRCRWRLQQIPYRGQPPDARDELVTIHLQLRDGLWRIVSGE